MKAYGHERSRLVPADGGRPKVCPKCDKWFSQRPRERVCTGCRPRQVAARVMARRPLVKSAKLQVGRAICMDLARAAAREVDERVEAERERRYLRLVHADGWPRVVTEL